MKKGDLLVCVNLVCVNNVFTFENITINKIYVVYNIGGSNTNPVIVNDNGRYEWFPKSLFITLKECRKRKLKKLEQL